MAQTLSRTLEDLVGLTRRVACTDNAGAVRAPDDGFDRCVDLFVGCGDAGGTVLWVGNGGSAALASHFAVDVFNAGVRSTAFNDAALLTCMGNDCGYEQVFARPVALFSSPGDVLIAISSSGRSPNILAAVGAARARGCAVVTLSGFRPDNPLRGLGDWNFFVPSEAYGPVEMAHALICHALVDALKERRRG
ncbi:MAG: SIS domain-containing protein [Candidatus Methylomirabilia bacterium]